MSDDRLYAAADKFEITDLSFKCMRKLVHIIFGVLKNKTSFQAEVAMERIEL